MIQTIFLAKPVHIQRDLRYPRLQCSKPFVHEIVRVQQLERQETKLLLVRL